MSDRTVVFATKNPAKFGFFNALLSPLKLTITSLLEYPDVQQAPEDSPTPEENARQKAEHAYKQLGVPCFAIDTSIFIEGLAEDQQPGVFVRRLRPERGPLSDDEMIEYYAGLFASLGGEVNGLWTTAIALVSAKGEVHSRIFQSKTLFLEKPNPNRTAGEPLNSLQFNSVLGKYVSDMSLNQRILTMGARATGILDFMAEHKALL